MWSETQISNKTLPKTINKHRMSLSNNKDSLETSQIINNHSMSIITNKATQLLLPNIIRVILDNNPKINLTNNQFSKFKIKDSLMDKA